MLFSPLLKISVKYILFNFQSLLNSDHTPLTSLSNVNEEIKHHLQAELKNVFIFFLTVIFARRVIAAALQICSETSDNEKENIQNCREQKAQ